MNSNYKNCFSDDLDYIKRREELYKKNKEVFKQTLNCLLDTATMIPVCEEEYRKDAPFFSQIRERIRNAAGNDEQHERLRHHPKIAGAD